jgi:hypothetical protein
MMKETTMRKMSPALEKALDAIAATRTLPQLFRTYETQEERIAEYGGPGEARILWQAYYDRIGKVTGGPR